MTVVPADADSARPPSAPPPPASAPRPAGGTERWWHRLSLSRFTERQVALGVMMMGLLVYLPLAGSYGLYDPWETHYGEVARQMTQRGDYISLWWPGAPIDAEHFWSKPVLSFWIMSLSLRLFGLFGQLPPGELALSTRPEWALRLPFCLLGVLGIYAVYLCLARFVSRRAGVLGAIVLATSPLYSLVSRQAMTDMAFVGPMTMALVLGAMALFDDEDAELPRRQWRRLSWPDHGLFYGALAIFTVSALPQLIIDSIQLRWTVHLGRSSVVLPGVVPMLPWIVGFAAFVWLAARIRFKAPLYLCIAAVLCGLAMLAKGLAGLGLPVIIFIAYLAFTWSWRRLSRAQIGFGIALSLIACAVVAVPWHQSMLIRHGFPFWDELYGENHWRRLVVGRHGDRGTFEYFVRELGYAVLPWIAVAPAALAALVMRPLRDARKQGIFWLGAIWFVSAYVLVSLSVTKFHHYILPALPGLAIVIGCFLDDVIDRADARVAAAMAVVGLPFLGVVLHDLVAAPNGAQRFIWLFSYDYINAPKGRPWPPSLNFGPALIGFAVVLGIFTAGLGWRRVQRGALVGLCAASIAFTYFLLDGYMMKITPFWTQKGLIATYYRQRRSPAEHLLAWQMYWRGENFYTENEIFSGPREERTVFLGDRNVENLKDWMNRHRGRRAFLIIERSRWSQLEGIVPADARASLKMIDESNMKFCLARIDL